MQALYAAKTWGDQAQQNRMNVISNNIANVNTPGYKEPAGRLQGCVVYTDTRIPRNLQQTVVLKKGTGVLTAATNRDLYAGHSYSNTGESYGYVY